MSEEGRRNRALCTTCVISTVSVGVGEIPDSIQTSVFPHGNSWLPYLPGCLISSSSGSLLVLCSLKQQLLNVSIRAAPSAVSSFTTLKLEQSSKNQSLSILGYTLLLKVLTHQKLKHVFSFKVCVMGDKYKVI